MASDVTLGAILNHPVVETLPPELSSLSPKCQTIFTDTAHFQPSTKARVIEV